MAVTFVSAAGRDVRSAAIGARRLGEEHLLLAATSLVAVLAIGLAYSGRLSVTNALRAGETATVNLNAVETPQQLERALERVFSTVADRRFAADGLFAFIRSSREAGDDLRNVGELIRVGAPADVIRQQPGLTVYRQRLARAEQAAIARNAAPPVTVPLLTSAEIAAIKPALVVRTSDAFSSRVAFWGAAYFLSFWLLAGFWWMRGFRGDGVLLAAAHFLTALAFAGLLARPDPLRDTLLFVRYSQAVAAGAAVWGLVSLLDFRRAAFLTLSYLPLAGALLLCAVLIVFGDGPGNGGVKVNLGPVQPIEAIRLLLAMFLAGYFARRWELLRQLNSTTVRNYAVPRWLAVPRLEYVLPVLIGIGAALLFFFLQKDLGPALFISCVFLAMYAVARARTGMALAGLLALAAGFYVGYKLDVSSTLVARVEMWLSPWDNAVRGGDQVAQATWALATGGLFGTGLGLGDTRYLPAGHTDLALAAIGEELGFLGLVVVGIVYCLIAARGFRIALRASNDYGFFLATAVTLFLTLAVLVMAAGMLGIIPLTGVVTPFVSYGGSAMVANFAALGMLNAVRNQGASAAAALAPFRRPVQRLSATMAVCAAGLLAVVFGVQVVSADESLVRPHLGIQADGVRRFQYNQRVLDVAAAIPRGTIFDRTGLPLATSDDAVMPRMRERYAKAGITPHRSCADTTERCYPLGGAAFHLLGDVRTRANWSASNTSYAERDFESRLRGFDDRATTVQVSDRSGGTVSTLQRDYGDLVPLIRHRHQPDHAAVAAFKDRSRDVTLTIDARLQTRVASILAAHAGKSTLRQAAAVVLDPDTGDLLAVASYPRPEMTDDEHLAPGEGDSRDALLDRARYGLYPPGSTFKLVTAAAALRQNRNSDRSTFVCRLLPDGRIGARISGFRPIRDDVLDKHAHGNIDLHDGLVKSCNAYFAQLAVRVGPEALLDTAARLGISLTPSNSVERLRATLPQAGYGQGDVVASPLRMARVVAAIAGQGFVREPRLDTATPVAPKPESILTADAAARLARSLRDAVLSGTGRALSRHPGLIAGKTGTAEVHDARSHSWFIGFAPYGGKKKIAFAVLVENAGYGGLAAAPVAGEIVTAATDLGLIR